MKRILIVDDAIDLGRLLQDALKTVHPEIPISVVPSAEEALLESTRFTIDVLVADIRLPGMTGLDLVRKIRVRQPNVKVILMTGLRPEDRLFKQKDEAAPDIFLRKPIMTPDFLAAVDQLLGEMPGAAEGEKPAAAPQPAKSPAAATPTQPRSKATGAFQEAVPADLPFFKAAAEKISELEKSTPVEKPAPAAAKPAPVEKGAPVEKPAQPAEKSTPAAPVSKKEQDAQKAALLNELAGVLPGEAVAPAQKPPARRTTGRLKMPEEPAKPAEEETGLSAVLSRLRGSLGAHTVMLLDERGRPVAQAGNLPEIQVEEQLAPPLMASLSASAKISYKLGQDTTQLVQAYRGTVLDLVAAPVGQYVLLIWLPTGRSALRLALAFEEAIAAQAEISAALEAMGLRLLTAVETGAPEVLLAEMSGAGTEEEGALPPEMAETPLGQDPGLEKLEELFSQKDAGQTQILDLDSFWEQAGNERKEIDQSGVLSFEQAQKLGLFPPGTKE